MMGKYYAATLFIEIYTIVDLCCPLPRFFRIEASFLSTEINYCL